MSLDALRDAISREKKNEIANCELSRKRKLRELYNYTALLNAGHPPQLQDWLIPDEPSENERRFLDENDISKGRLFRDSTLPFVSQHASPQGPSPFFPTAKSFLPHLSKSSPSPAPPAPSPRPTELTTAPSAPTPSPAPPSVEVSATPDAVPVGHTPPGLPDGKSVSPVRSTPPVSVELPSKLQDDAPRLDLAEPTQKPHVEREFKEKEPSVDGPSAPPADVIPPTADDTAGLPDSTLQTVAPEEPPKPPPQVVHLPSREEQESRLQETEENLQKAAEKERREDEKLGPPAGSNVELASSPSSTVGPYSAATPHPQHHSPDTSPGSESFEDSVSHQPPPGLVDSVAQKEKEDHDRALQAQIQAARDSARTPSPATPNAQLQFEDEQAIRLARDGKSRLTEALPATAPNSLTQHVEEVVAGAQADVGEDVNATLSEPAAESLPTPATTGPEPSTSASSSVDNVPEKRPESAAIPEQPTPPADVEMDDVPAAPVDTQTPSPSRPERMTTRVSSGAIPRRSVSDIIREATAPGETPKATKTPSPSTSPSKPQVQKEKAKVPTVIFAKQDNTRPSKALQLWSEDYAALQGASQDSSRDYLQGLFQYQAHHQPRSIPLQELLASARKTVSTAATLATLRECQDYKILKRVYQLQNANRWSLRQIQKAAEPPRPITHQDHLLAEMKWMQTDFKEERKWKRALALTFAEWCADYINSTPEQRASLRVKTRAPRRIHAEDEDMNDAPTPDLISSTANETESDDELFSISGATPPATLFSLGFNDVVIKMDSTPASLTMLQELPFYEPDVEKMSDVTPRSFCDPPLLPVSKFVSGKLISNVRGPPKKRSRYDYESEDEPTRPPSRSATSAEHSMPSTPGRRFNRNDLPPEMTDVALFIPENKHVRDRLQAAHHFRPPSEYQMPSVAFFENRTSSQWLWDEDQKLRTLVREHTFNWSLVSQELGFQSAYTSGAERRTPWECFERWVQLEGLPHEMARTQYFRTYQTRLEQAQRTVTAAQQAAQQQAQQQGQNGQVRRRNTTQPIRVERRRNNRYLALIDAMRKLARKRESARHKTEEAQKAAALRKEHQPAQAKNVVHSPQEFSRLKWEREEKLREQQQQLKQQQLNNMRTQAMVTAAAQRQASMGGQPGMANGVPAPQRNGTPSNGNAPTPMSASTSQQGHPAQAAMQARPHPGQPQMQANFPNGNMSGMPMGVSGIPQAQMQANMQSQQRMGPPDNVRLAAMQQRQFGSAHPHPLQFQQQQINMVSNLANAHLGANLTSNAMQNAGMMAAMAGQNMNGNNAPPMNGIPGAAGSPRMGQVNASRQLSSGHIPHLQVATEQLTKLLNRNRTTALNAATGSPGMAGSSQIGNNVYMQNSGMGASPPTNSVQNYQNQLLQQQRMMSQQRAQQAGSPSLSNAPRPPSRSATPQNPQQMQQSPAMQQAQLARN